MKGYKQWLSVLTLVVMVLGLMVWGASVSSGIDEIPDTATRVDAVDRDDVDDSSWQGILGRLESVVRVMGNMNCRLEKISSGFDSPPPEDMESFLRDALNEIKTEANHAITHSDDMLRLVGGPPEG